MHVFKSKRKAGKQIVPLCLTETNDSACDNLQRTLHVTTSEEKKGIQCLRKTYYR